MVEMMMKKWKTMRVVKKEAVGPQNILVRCGLGGDDDKVSHEGKRKRLEPFSEVS
jgi:hypothetical protein